MTILGFVDADALLGAGGAAADGAAMRVQLKAKPIDAMSSCRARTG
jgi:hypothetical protein